MSGFGNGDAGMAAMRLAERLEGEVTELRTRVQIVDRDATNVAADLCKVRDDLRASVSELNRYVTSAAQELRAVVIRFERALAKHEQPARRRPRARRK